MHIIICIRKLLDIAICVTRDYCDLCPKECREVPEKTHWIMHSSVPKSLVFWGDENLFLDQVLLLLQHSNGAMIHLREHNQLHLPTPQLIPQHCQVAIHIYD